MTLKHGTCKSALLNQNFLDCNQSYLEHIVSEIKGEGKIMQKKKACSGISHGFTNFQALFFLLLISLTGKKDIHGSQNGYCD